MSGKQHMNGELPVCCFLSAQLLHVHKIWVTKILYVIFICVNLHIQSKNIQAILAIKQVEYEQQSQNNETRLISNQSVLVTLQFDEKKNSWLF